MVEHLQVYDPFKSIKQAKASGVDRTELFLRTLRTILKTMPRVTSKIGATLKGKNLLPVGANSFL